MACERLRRKGETKNTGVKDMAANHLKSVSGSKPQKTNPRAASEAFLTDKNNRCWPSKAGLVRAGAVLEFMPCSVALWSHDRSLCVFNDSTRQLLGFCERDFRQTTSLWLNRVHPQDRDRLVSAWNKLQQGEGKISCQYRFLPKHQAQQIRLREVSFSYPVRGGDAPGIWSFYVEESDEEVSEIRQVRELVRGLTHEIANGLQVISGELDLLILAGALPQRSSKAIGHGVQQILKIAHEIEEYLEPPQFQLRSEDPAVVLTEVIRDSERELAEHGIRMAIVLRESLPKLPLDWQFRKALRRVIEFSCALLPQGGELKIEAGLRWVEGDRYVELSLINASPTYLNMESNDVFRPFLKVNDRQVGLSMVMARQILRRGLGKIVFHNEHGKRGVFSILIKVVSEN
jgi:PAS fold